jgi:endonuclease YncB( thermonuclease family)
VKKLLFLILLFTATAASAQDLTGKVASVYDGDTFRVVPKNLPNYMGDSIPVRIIGIDAPEMRGKCTQEKERAIAARNVLMGLISARDVTLVNVKRDKYFRLLAIVKVNNLDVGEHMIKTGYAVKYQGKKRGDWCNK